MWPVLNWNARTLTTKHTEIHTHTRTEHSTHAKEKQRARELCGFIWIENILI